MQYKTFEQFCRDNQINKPEAVSAARLAWDYQIALADPLASSLLRIGKVVGGLPKQAGEAILAWRGSREPRCHACKDTGVMVTDAGEPSLCGCKLVLEERVEHMQDLIRSSQGDAAAAKTGTTVESFGILSDAAPTTTGNGS